MASNNNPSIISGHAQYVKGYAAETIGNVTGNKEWQESGKQDAKAGIDEMKVRSSLPSFPLLSSLRSHPTEETRSEGRKRQKTD